MTEQAHSRIHASNENPLLSRSHGMALLVLGFLLIASWIPGLFYQARDVDVLLYSSAAVRANAEHALPYEAAWIEKGPVAMGLYQGLFALFGPYNMSALAGAWLFLVAVSMGATFSLAREVGAAQSAVWAPLFFALSIPRVGGTLNTEIPAAAAASWAVLLWCRAHRSQGGHLWLAASAGGLVAAAFLSRQNAGALWPILVVGEAAWVRWTGFRAARAALSGLAVTGGFLLVFFIVLSIYAFAGELGNFYFCFYGYNTDFYIAATRVDWPRILVSPWTAFEHFFLPASITGPFGLVGLAVTVRSAMRGTSAWPRSPALLVVSLTAVGLTLSLFVGFRFFSHYFALVLPFWAVLAAVAVDRASARLSRSSRPWLRSRGPKALAWGLVLVMAFALLDVPWRLMRSQLRQWARAGGPSHTGDPLRWPGADPMAAAAARFIRNESLPTDRVFVWGMRPHIYAYSGLVPATRFVTCTFLTGLVPWERIGPEDDTAQWIVPGSWDLLMEDLHRAEPRFIVDASQDHLFGQGAHPPENFPRLKTFMDLRYEPVFETGEDDRVIVWQRRRRAALPPRVQEALHDDRLSEPPKD